MTTCIHRGRVFRRRNCWQDKRQRMLKKMENMRAAKARKRLENPPEHEPKMVPWHRFEFGVRDKVTGRASYGEAWTDFVSIRDAVRRLRVIQKYCHES